MTLQVKILDCHRLLLIRAAEFFYMQGTWPSPNMRHSFISRQSQAADTPYQSYFLYSGIVCIYEITDPICVTWSIPDGIKLDKLPSHVLPYVNIYLKSDCFAREGLDEDLHSVPPGDL
jgi:hypothetical protein